jgi:hypothetical protein
MVDSSSLDFADKSIFGIHIVDSLDFGDRKRYIFNRYFHHNINWKPSSCNYFYNRSPFGRFFDINEGRFTLFTDMHTPITFHFSSNIGDSIVVVNDTNNWVITLTEQREMSVFGLTDSVKIFTISKNVLTPYYDSIILSKHYGFIRVPVPRNFNSVDNSREFYRKYDWDVAGTLKLVGNTAHPNNPHQPLKYADCFDFKIGDVHHIEENHIKNYYKDQHIPIPPRTETTKQITISTVLNRMDYNDSIVYRIKNEVYTAVEIKSIKEYSFVEQVKRDTVKSTISLSPQFMDTVVSGTLKLTNSFIGPEGMKLFVTKKTSNNILGVEEVYMSDLRDDNDSCLYQKADWSKGSDKLYLKSLGGPYYKEALSDWFMSGWDWEYERKLIYYSNSSGTWGTPYPFPLGLNKNHHTISDWVKIYPNPAKDWIQISATQAAHLSIYDLQGRIVYEAILSANENTQIPCSEWNAGVYIAKATSHKGTQYVKVVVSR